MADNNDPTLSNPDLKAALKAGGIESEAPTGEYQPVYKMVGDAKIPVTKAMGKFWMARRDIGLKARTDVEKGWDEAVRYYNNDQMRHRNTRNEASGNNTDQARMSNTWTQTENVVFSNTSTMLPLLYSKNPSVEFTATDEQQKDAATMYEHLINTLFNKREAPGVNLKPAARRGILHCLLMNEGWIKIGWTQKQDSSQQAMQDLQKLSEQLAKADDISKIKDIEGQLKALEEQIDLLTPPGCTRKVVHPKNIIVDPDCGDPDGADANWLMECDMLPTAYLKARFAKQNDDGKLVSIYAPTHVLKLKDMSGSDGEDNDALADVNGFTLALGDGAESTDGKAYGFTDSGVFQQAWMTKVWYVWDKTTRRMYMYNDKDWSWPIWVWNDPYKLLEFFPYYRLHFHEAIEGVVTRGEVTYYLDQQDEINDINSEKRNARQWARRNVFYDKASGMSRDDVEQVLKGADGTVRGLTIPEGKKPEDVIFSIKPPALTSLPQLFDTAPAYAAIQRLSSVSAVLSGEQFKTNTTNQAVQSYQQSAAIRSDEKTDAIEDWLGRIGFGIAQLCVQFMDQQTVVGLIGQDGAGWEQMDAETFRTKMSMRIVGGSTQKPTSAAKKQEALQIGQVLGQFAGKVPPVALFMLQVFEQAFDEITVSDDDWKQLQQAVTQMMQQGQGQGGGGDPLQQIVSQLPPPLQQAFEAAVQKGVPPQVALAGIMQQLHGQQPGADGQQPAQGEQG